MNEIEFINDKTTYALEELDLKLKKYLSYPNGVFLEVGANDGIRQSNTYIFEKFFGWTGILIEPSSWYNYLTENRPNSIIFNCALVSYDWNLPTIKGSFINSSIEAGNLMSTTEQSTLFKKNQSIEVKASTIDDVISTTTFTKFDLISLDCEGSEFSILNGFNFRRHSTKYFLIEIFNDNYENFNQILHLLRDNGYEIEDRLGNHDFIFKNKNI